jgi:hypothetical protein
VIEDCAFSEVDQQCSSICLSVAIPLYEEANIPSSNDSRRFPSGDRAIHEIFFLFSNDKVLDLLLSRQRNPA